MDTDTHAAASAFRSAVKEVTHRRVDIKKLALNTQVRTFNRLFQNQSGKGLFTQWVKERGAVSPDYWAAHFLNQLKELNLYRGRADHAGKDSLSERDAEHVRSLLVQPSQSSRGLLVELVSLET